MAKPKADRKAKGSEPQTDRNDKGQFTEAYEGGPGRNTIYTDEIGDTIEARLAGGETLIAICRDEGMPDERTVRGWALKPQHPFYPKYTRGRELGYMRMADELIHIMDDGQNDWMARQIAEMAEDDPRRIAWQLNGEHVARSRLRIDGRKWLLSKALPKIYGDKVALTDAEGGKLVIEFST